jgi:hypothetical protein
VDKAPDPMTLHPVVGAKRVVFLKPLVTHPNVEVGEYTYYDDPDDPGRPPSRSGSSARDGRTRWTW